MPDLPLTGYSDYRPVKSDNTLPLDFFAGGVRYKKELFINVPAGFGTSKILEGSFKNQILDAPGGKVLFEQEVAWGALLAEVGIFATWFPTNMGSGYGVGEITTTIINGEEIDPATAWQFVDVAQPTEFSETLGYTDFEAQGVVSVFGWTFMATWYSPPYRVNIPAGAVLHRVFDHWGIGTIDDRATFGFSFREGSQYISNWVDDFRANRVATPDNNYAQVSFNYPHAGFRAPRRRSRLALRNAVTCKDHHNRLFVAGLDGNEYKLLYSHDDGRSFKPMRYEYITTPIMPIWNSGETNHDLTTDGTGGFVSIAQLGPRIYAKLSVDGVIWSLPRLVAVRQKNEPYTVRCSPRTGEIFVSNGDLSHVLRSRDGGRSWEDVSP